MILLLLEFLKSLSIKIPAVFFYTSTRMILAAITALTLSILLGPRFIKKLYELKIGQTIRTDECPLLGSLHRNKNNTPTMGGILILFSITVSLLLWMDFSSVYTWIFMLVILFFGFIGGMDDYLKLKHRDTKGLTARKKLMLQALFSSLIASYFLFSPVAQFVDSTLHIKSPVVKEEVGKKIDLQDYMTRLYVPFMKGPLLNFGVIAALLWIAFVVTGSSNAVNLTDGLDGLAAGCLVMTAAVFALIAFLSNNIEMASYLKHSLHRREWRDCHLPSCLYRSAARLSLVQRPSCPAVHGGYRIPHPRSYPRRLEHHAPQRTSPRHRRRDLCDGDPIGHHPSGEFQMAQTAGFPLFAPASPL